MLYPLILNRLSNYRKYLCAFVMSLYTILSFAQLSDFELSVTVTDETCSGNGGLQMSVANTTAGADIIFTLYELPDDSTPIAETTATAFDNLVSGNYRVVATQTLSGEENQQQQDVTINDFTSEIDFEVNHTTNTDCDPTGTIVVNVTSGNAFQYEILSGPVTAELQESNQFENLPPGTYIVRVFDDCGNALSKSYTLILSVNNISINPSTLPVVYDSCDEVTITNIFSAPPQNPILYPLTVTYTIIPPDGAPEIIIVEELTSGPSQTFNMSQTVMTYGDASFTVHISITDSCDNVFERDNTIDPNPSVQLFPTEAYCGKSLNLIVNHFLPPYQVDFIEAPSDFNPVDYNEDYPGPFFNSVTTFEAQDMPVPYGSYTVQVTDECGRTGIHSLLLEEEPLEPDIIVNNTGCSVDSGFINVSIPDREVASASMLVAPASYGNTLPDDLSEDIDNGTLSVNNLASGDYTVLVIDNCGSEYLIETTVPEFVQQPLSIISYPNCLTETGSLRLASGYGALTSVIMTAAPSSYNQSLPDDLSDHINDLGIFFKNNLPAGSYTFELIDLCGYVYNPEVYVDTYVSNPNSYVLNRNCGSFDVGILETDDSVVPQSYWFQKYIPETESWGHPYTEVPYVEGDIPNTSTAIEIQNEETIFNIFLTGDFRLIKVFQPFNNENPDEFCLDIFAEFSIYSNLIISGVYNLSCIGGPGASDIIVDVIGVAPYNFSIIEPFVLDNGENNVFSNLDPGTYEIKVEDVCGSIENIIINLENLQPLVRVNQPDNLLVCSDSGATAATFNLSDQQDQILGNQDPNDFIVTFHSNMNDANSGNNPLPFNYTNTSNPQTIYVRVIHNTLDICYATTSFEIEVGDIPVLDPDATISICDSSTTLLTATSGYPSYEWSTGETSPSITVSQDGIYSVVVKNNFGDFSCESTQTFNVVSSNIATIESIETTDWTANSNTISVLVSGSGDYEFSLDGVNYQTENTFTNLPPGEYLIYVKDRNGCGIATEEVFLLNYPSFFTPNDDGYNDFWHIKLARIEPELRVFIFDRYGKLLTYFNGQDFGWDGTYNGQKMPTNDYWFLVERTNGKTYKGHFTLKR
ncbi:MAG: T9SS type B sorting domain-containing protein [Algicola sp.]|nr:T9SS type B sorting domain-containing protein [Algicola sp.]